MGRKGNKQKRPKADHTPNPKKQPTARAQPPVSDDKRPSWRVARMECLDPFGAWHEVNQVTLLDIRSKLGSFESMTWSEILVQGEKQHHPVAVSSLIKEAGDRLVELKLDEYEELVSLRIGGKKRIYGIREGATLMLLWWDPDHKIYPSKKKNT